MRTESGSIAEVSLLRISIDLQNMTSVTKMTQFSSYAAGLRGLGREGIGTSMIMQY